MDGTKNYFVAYRKHPGLRMEITVIGRNRTAARLAAETEIKQLSGWVWDGTN